MQQLSNTQRRTRTPEQRKAARAQAAKEELRARVRGDKASAASWARLYDIMSKGE